MHPFETAGLGRAPFRIVGYSRNVGPRRLPDGTELGAPGQPLGTCDVCGTGIADEYHVVSSDGRRFIAGCDCVEKTARDDNRLLTDLQRQQAIASRAKRAAKLAAKRALETARAEERYAAERAANGGLTDREMQEQQRAEDEAARVAAHTASNRWLIDAVDGMGGDFIHAAVDMLQRGPIAGLPDRMVAILCDIYCKRSGRRGSKAYDAACDDFANRARL